MSLYPSIGPTFFWIIQKTFEFVQKCLDMGQKISHKKSFLDYSKNILIRPEFDPGPKDLICYKREHVTIAEIKLLNGCNKQAK